MAREAAKAADDRKLAAVKAAEEAKKDTEQATLLAAAKAAEGAKKDAQQTELAALSKEDTTKLDLFDGVWTIVRVVGVGANCLDRSHVTSSCFWRLKSVRRQTS